jgi:hypothetical protein
VFIAEDARGPRSLCLSSKKKARRWATWGGSTGESLTVLRRSWKKGVLQPKRNISTQKVFADATPKTTLRLWPAFDSFAHLAASLGIRLARSFVYYICPLLLGPLGTASCCLSFCVTANAVFKLRHHRRRASSSARAEGSGGPDEVFILSAS